MKKHIISMDFKTKFLLRISICFTLFIIISLGVIYAVNVFSSKGELNDDGVIDYKDVSLLEMHLINLRKLSEEKLQ